MAIKPPEFPNGLRTGTIESDVREAIKTGEGIENCRFEGGALDGIDTGLLDFSGCVFIGVHFGACAVDRLHFTDCRLVRCDLSGLRLREGALRRVALEGCRAAGAQFEGMILRDAAFYDCDLRYAGFSRCRMQDAAFADVRLDRSIFHSCAKKGLLLERCDLTEAELVGSPLQGVDLSTCTLDGLRAAPALLAGTTAALDQAPALLGLFGIRLKV